MNERPRLVPEHDRLIIHLLLSTSFFCSCPLRCSTAIRVKREFNREGLGLCNPRGCVLPRALRRAASFFLHARPSPRRQRYSNAPWLAPSFSFLRNVYRCFLPLGAGCPSLSRCLPFHSTPSTEWKPKDASPSFQIARQNGNPISASFHGNT